MDINVKTYYYPFHRFFDVSYKNDIIINNEDDIIDTVITFFKNGKYEYIEPAQTIYRSLIYAALSQKNFGKDFYKCLDDKDLVYDNLYFKKYSENKELYDKILSKIIDIFFYNISYIEQEFNKEYYRNNLQDYGCFIHGNDIIIINHYFNHYRYLITKNYLRDYIDELLTDENYVKYKISLMKDYVKNGNIKISVEYNTAGIMYSNISEKDKFSMYYYFQNKNVNKFITENIYNNRCNEYYNLNDLMGEL